MVEAFSSPMFKQRILDRRKVAAQHTIPAYVAQTAKFDIAMVVGDELLARIEAEVLAEHVESRTQYAKLFVPSSWWQRLKMDHFPGWFVRKWPVKRTPWQAKVQFKRFMHYPDAKIALPEERFGRPIIYEEVHTGDWMQSA